MVPCSFPGENLVLNRPEEMTDDECTPLCVRRERRPDGMPVVVSCWKLTVAEWAQLNQTGKIWLTVCGLSMPPVILGTEKPFEE